MTQIEQAIARLEELGNYGFRPPIQYVQVTDSLAFVRQDLELVKKHLLLLFYYRNMNSQDGFERVEMLERIAMLEKELGKWHKQQKI